MLIKMNVQTPPCMNAELIFKSESSVFMLRRAFAYVNLSDIDVQENSKTIRQTVDYIGFGM